MPQLPLLVELLKKISQTKDRVHIELDYNGREFNWKLVQNNITAAQWTPGSAREHEPDAIDSRQRNL